jgi:hypothetical protein
MARPLNDALHRFAFLFDTGNSCHIRRQDPHPIEDHEALRGLLKFTPTEDMARPGAQPTKPKKKAMKKLKPNRGSQVRESNSL